MARSWWSPLLALLAALLLITALLVWPASRWLVAYQLKSLVSRPEGLYAILAGITNRSSLERLLGIDLPAWVRGADPQPKEARQRLLRQAMARHPDDWQLQFGGIMVRPSNHIQDELRALSARFPDQPALQAHLLRHSCWHVAPRHRPEVALAVGNTPPQPLPTERPSAAAWAEYDRTAAEGERLDPDNAFFPYMRAVGLFGIGRDAEALAAVARAADKPRWDDYGWDQTQARWRVLRDAFGEQTAFTRGMDDLAIPSPHLTPQRVAAQMAVYYAVRAEQADRREEGHRIRQALLRHGGRMREQSSSLMGNAVGIAIEKVAMCRPEGILAPTKQKGSEYAAHYTAYLTRIGHAKAAGQVERHWAAIDASSALSEQFGAHYRTTRQLLPLWAGSLAALVGSVWLLLTGGVFSVLARRRREEARGWPVLLGLGLVLVALLLITRERLALLVNQGLILYALYVREPQAIDPPSWAMGSLGTPVGHAWALLTLAFSVGALWVWSRRWRTLPAASRLARGAVAAGSVTLILYAGLALATAHYEARLSNALEQSNRHAGRYVAALSGKPWPPAQP